MHNFYELEPGILRQTWPARATYLVTMECDLLNFDTTTYELF